MAMTGAERLRQEGRLEGRLEGRREGEKKGRLEGEINGELKNLMDLYRRGYQPKEIYESEAILLQEQLEALRNHMANQKAG